MSHVQRANDWTAPPPDYTVHSSNYFLTTHAGDPVNYIVALTVATALQQTGHERTITAAAEYTSSKLCYTITTRKCGEF